MAASCFDLGDNHLVILCLRGSFVRANRPGGGSQIYSPLPLPHHIPALSMVLLENRVDSSRRYTTKIQVSPSI